MKILITLLIIIACLLPISAMAGAYCSYRTADGKITLSNQSISSGMSIIRCHDWRDATDTEIAVITVENRRTETVNLERDRMAAIDRLTSEIIKAKMERAPQAEQPIYINVNTSTVKLPAIKHLRRGK